MVLRTLRISARCLGGYDRDMTKKGQFRFIALSILAATWVIAIAAPSWAPRSWSVVAQGADCWIGDDDDDKVSESYAVSLASFGVDSAGDVVARGTIAGRCGASEPSFNERLQTPVEVESASCAAATLRLEDVTLEPEEYDEPVTVELTDDRIIVVAEDGRLKGALCNLRAVFQRGNTKILVGALNRVLG